MSNSTRMSSTQRVRQHPASTTRHRRRRGRSTHLRGRSNRRSSRRSNNRSRRRRTTRRRRGAARGRCRSCGGRRYRRCSGSRCGCDVAAGASEGAPLRAGIRVNRTSRERASTRTRRQRPTIRAGFHLRRIRPTLTPHKSPRTARQRRRRRHVTHARRRPGARAPRQSPTRRTLITQCQYLVTVLDE